MKSIRNIAFTATIALAVLPTQASAGLTLSLLDLTGQITVGSSFHYTATLTNTTGEDLFLTGFGGELLGDGAGSLMLQDVNTDASYPLGSEWAELFTTGVLGSGKTVTGRLATATAFQGAGLGKDGVFRYSFEFEDTLGAVYGVEDSKVLNVVPEPSTAALALFVAPLLARRRKRSAVTHAK
jgi:hypothetical protein